MSSPQFLKRRDKAAAEIRDVMSRMRRETVRHDELAGILIEYHRTILIALERGLAYLKCLRCGERWPRRKEVPPQQCPRCHSPYWDKPRRKIAE